MNWKKGALAVMLLAGSMAALTGCGGNEREKALSPFIGTWVATDKLPSGKEYNPTITIERNEQNQNVLVANFKSVAVFKIEKSHVITYDEKDKAVKMDNIENLVIQKDDKGEYFSGNGMAIPSHKYYKQK